MTQLVTRIDDDLAASLDELIAEGGFESRSEAVRTGLRLLIERHRRERVGEAIVTGYQNQPQTKAESTWLDAATMQMIAEEPW